MNIWFALTGLEDRRRGSWSNGPRDSGFGKPIPFDLPTAVSQVTNGGGSFGGGFKDEVELANAAYGQAETLVTPLQMALVAATIANGGVRDAAAARRTRITSAKTGTTEIQPMVLSSVLPANLAADDLAGDAAGRRRPVRRALHDRRRGAGHSDGRQVRHGAARAPASRTPGSSASRRRTTRRSRSRSWSSTAVEAAPARRPWRANCCRPISIP